MLETVCRRGHVYDLMKSMICVSPERNFSRSTNWRERGCAGREKESRSRTPCYGTAGWYRGLYGEITELSKRKARGDMTIDELLTELQVRYPDGATWRERVVLTNVDILKWTASACMPRQDLYDQLAIGLARGFHASELSFEFCDTVVNEVHSVMIFMNEQRPLFFWEIYLAFDSGSIITMATEISTRVRHTHGPRSSEFWMLWPRFDVLLDRVIRG